MTMFQTISPHMLQGWQWKDIQKEMDKVAEEAALVAAHLGEIVSLQPWRHRMTAAQS